MGYRSDITAVFYTKDAQAWPVMKLYIDENFPTVGDLIKDEDLTLLESKRVFGYVVKFTGWKWYEGYPEVQAWNRFVSNFLELADGDDHPWAYEFVRIGEDYNDVETTYSDKSEYVLNVVRDVEVNV